MQFAGRDTQQSCAMIDARTSPDEDVKRASTSNLVLRPVLGEDSAELRHQSPQGQVR